MESLSVNYISSTLKENQAQDSKHSECNNLFKCEVAQFMEHFLDLFFAIDKIQVSCLILKRINKFIFENEYFKNCNELDLKLKFVGMIPLNFLILHLGELNGNTKNQVKLILKSFILNLQSIIRNGESKLENKNDVKNNSAVTAVTLPRNLLDKIKKFEKYMKSDKNSTPITITINKATINSQKLYTDINNFKNIAFKDKGYREISIITTKLLKNILSISSENLVKIIYKSVLFDLLEEKNKTSLFNKKKSMIVLPEIFNLIPSAPFLPSQSGENSNRISLILDLDETLIHNLNTPKGNYFLVRPGTFEFLSECSKFYEIIIFTASAQDYADKILNSLDPEGNLIHHRLYRQHMSYENNSFKSSFKDLNKIGRDLSKLIFIDNSPENFKYNKENSLEIVTWEDDPYDKELDKILFHLINFAKQEFSDIRQMLNKMR